MVLTAACGGGVTRRSDAAGGASVEQIDKYLLAPASASRIDPAPGPIETDPITGATLSLPYKGAYAVPDGPIGDPSKTYTVCFSQALIRHPFPVALRSSLMLEAARHPNLKVLTYNTDNDPLKQVQDLETCAAQKPDAILVWPHSIAPLTPEIKKLTQQGFKVVGMERTVATSDYTSWIYLDDEAETKAMADAIAEKLGGSGVVAETSGAVGSSPQIVRSYGFKKELTAKAPGIKVVTTTPTDYSEAQGFQVALQFLGSPQGKDIKAWYVHSGTIALGIQKAMAQLKRTDIPIYTIDGSKQEVQAVQGGKITAITPHSPLIGDVALRLAIMAIEGKQVPKDLILNQDELITQSNAAEILPKAWGTLGTNTGF
ncbi:hypothetical protein GCM10009835_16360 [Planosporangium flavigriseum]|uniref:Periplasmic binding protein domain-containing protein n=1 Tax=Planosporangium flavigriseum TaxID=373681 RepID=A0A8J3LUL2_9ACTN|nr:hypothetical protein Pfl04_52170 [Planosporangium flavigriseum]